jgi:hypothetical protein
LLSLLAEAALELDDWLVLAELLA